MKRKELNIKITPDERKLLLNFITWLEHSFKPLDEEGKKDIQLARSLYNKLIMKG